MSRMVAIYATVSTEHEAQISALENQVQYYDDILAKHPDWTLYDKYIDEGITGTSVKKRKSFLRMMEDAEKGCFDLIVTREVSRFARNTVDTLQETRRLKKMGIEVYFTEHNIWTMNDEDGELRLTIMATLAQNESKKTSMRVKAGQKISFQNAIPYGSGNILGYDRIGKEMVINPEQAETVKLIYKLYLEGKGTRKICYELEKRGCLTSTGRSHWEAANVARILHNPFYMGTIVYRKCFVPDYLEQKQKKNEGEVEQVIVEGKHLVEEARKMDLIVDEFILNENVNEKVMKKLSSLNTIPTHLAICKKLEEKDINGNILLLDGISDPGNLGTIIRSSVAFGIDTIVLSTNTVDLYNDKVIRASEGMIFNINFIRTNLVDIINKLDINLYTTDVNNGTSLDDIKFVSPYGIVIGNEGSGVSKEVSDLIKNKINISMNNKCESLNVGVATSIILYVAERNK